MAVNTPVETDPLYYTFTVHELQIPPADHLTKPEKKPRKP